MLDYKSSRWHFELIKKKKKRFFTEVRVRAMSLS